MVDIDSETGEYTGDFLTRSNVREEGHVFKWPTNRDVFPFGKNDVLVRVSPPVCSGRTRKVFKLQEMDYSNIEVAWANYK